MPRRRRTGYRLKSGAVKIQVLLHPAEYAALAQRAKEQRASHSLVARSIIAAHFGQPAGDVAAPGKYQRRGFAHE